MTSKRSRDGRARRPGERGHILFQFAGNAVPPQDFSWDRDHLPGLPRLRGHRRTTPGRGERSLLNPPSLGSWSDWVQLGQKQQLCWDFRAQNLSQIGKSCPRLWGAATLERSTRLPDRIPCSRRQLASPGAQHSLSLPPTPTPDTQQDVRAAASSLVPEPLPPCRYWQ